MTRSSRTEREGTFWVLEDEPPPTRARWFCHWDGNTAPGFEDLEEAVAWGLARARTVVVRTLGTVYYWAGERPSNYDDVDLRPWAPSAGERRQMYADYEAALAAEISEDISRARYELDRDRWLGAHAPDLVRHVPAHKCLVLLSEDDDRCIEFEEFDADGTICGARRQGDGPLAFGSAEEVIANTSGLPVDDPWVGAVGAALARERAWAFTGRRSLLLVKMGEGEMFHATASTNRDSISRYGLDWRRMGAAPGIAGSSQPELPGIFLCDDREAARFFTDMGREQSDVWAVRVDGFWLEGDPGASGGGDSVWMILAEPVGPERLELVEADVPPGRRL